MKISIVTAVFNRADTIAQCIQSVGSQTHPDIEHIVVDGGSTDGTVDEIEKRAASLSRWLSEPDDGLYHAVNKGIGFATGDAVGILNADDLYAGNDVLDVVSRRLDESGADSCYGNLLYVAESNVDRVVRYWKACPFGPKLFRRGWMPPHPAFFVRREIYERYGVFNTEFRIAADYELMLRFLERHRISTSHIPKTLVRMRLGGMSNRRWRDMLTKSREDYRAWKVNGLRPSVLTILMKNVRKIPQFFRREGARSRAPDPARPETIDTDAPGA